MQDKNFNLDHLFRHQFGKMVSILTRIFGFEHLETIEDAVQDTFIKAIKSWRDKKPDNPEAWLMAAAKNRMLDIIKSVKAENVRKANFQSGPASFQISNLFLEEEIEDSQLRMIFTACHPALNPEEQIAFALRTISGFSSKEISSALLSPEETIKKRLQRARKTILREKIKFEIPQAKELKLRLDRVLEVLYLIFNEGFHSGRKELIIRKELCGESMRLMKFILKKEPLRNSKLYALFALMCFHASRLESKVNDQNELINIKEQDRQKWHFPLMTLGSEAMNQALSYGEPLCSFHYEAAIAAEHLRAQKFESTNWNIILEHYQNLQVIQPSPMNLLNIAIVQLQLDQTKAAFETLQEIKIKALSQRAYLYHATMAEYYKKTKQRTLALSHLDLAIGMANNRSEKEYFLRKKIELS